MIAYIGLKTCIGKYLPLTHFMPGPGLIVNTLVQGFLITPGGKRGEEKIENPDWSSSLMHALPRHDFRFMVSASHVFYALVLIL